MSTAFIREMIRSFDRKKRMPDARPISSARRDESAGMNSSAAILMWSARQARTKREGRMLWFVVKSDGI